MSEEPRASEGSREVTVTDIQMPIGSMIVFMVKWAIASIPALIIFLIIIGLSIPMLVGIATSAFRGLMGFPVTP